MKHYTIRKCGRPDGFWTLFDGTGPVQHRATVQELIDLLPKDSEVEVIGKTE